MKIIILTIIIAIIGLVACSKGLQMKKVNANDGEWCDGIQPPKSVLPFWDVGIKQARLIAHRRVQKGKQTAAYRQLIIVILHPEEDEAEAVKAMGFDKADEKLWDEKYYGILLKADNPDAQEIIEQYNIHDFPATIKETKSIDGKETFFKIWYGYLPEVSGNNEYDVRSIIQDIYSEFKAGNADQKLLIQLRDHIELLELEEEDQRQLYFEITNTYLNQFPKDDFKEFSTYRAIKKELKDVRFDLILELLKNRTFYNQAFVEVCRDKAVKAHQMHDADLILNQAILSSFQKAAENNDQHLFQSAMAIKDQYESGYMTPFIAKSILEYQIAQNDPIAIRKAALQYFSLNRNWTSTRSELLEASANSIYTVSEEPAEFELAEKWIARVIEKYPNPTNYRLQANLLSKLERRQDLEIVLEKIKSYRKSFESFKNLYPEINYPITINQEDISKTEYKNMTSISREYKLFYQYIAREGSLYKKGQKIEPLALLSQTSSTVTLLTRVHLATGSILPVIHYRSYHIKSTFSMEGEHIQSDYVVEKTL